MLIFANLGIYLYQDGADLHHISYNYTVCYPTITTNEYARLHYCQLNFATLWQALVTLNSVAVGNNWHGKILEIEKTFMKF